MAGVIHKVKEMLSGGDHDADTSSTSHSTSHSTGATGATGTHGLGGHQSTTASPHASSMANKVDPRVDPDLDGSRNMGARGATSGTAGTGLAGAVAGVTGSHHTTAGSHSSNLANKADPRVGSDLDGFRNMGAAGGYGTSSTGMTGAGMTGVGVTGTGVTGAAVGSTHGHSHGHLHDVIGHHHPHEGFDHHVGGTGHHTTMAGQALDPNIPHAGSSGLGTSGTAGLGSSGIAGAGITGSGLTGSHHSTAGPHSSDMLNRADPRIDSDLDGSRNMGAAGGYGTSGMTGAGLAGAATGMTGSHRTTAGPHSSDMMNRADPRVDSDRDGSSSLDEFRNKVAHSHFGTIDDGTRQSSVARDPKDTAHASPSAFREHSEVEVMHSGDPNDHRRRHSAAEPKADHLLRKLFEPPHA